MLKEFSRTAMLLGDEAIEKLSNAHICIFGIGGVGSFAAEALIRSGVGNITIVDNDEVSITNINRQLIATKKTIGMKKVDVMKERMKDINSDAVITTMDVFYSDTTAMFFDFSKYDYIIDAIDTVSAKLLLVEKAGDVNTPIISCMGTGNKLDPTMFEISDIFKTSICPLAKVMRHELRKRGIKKLKVLYSKEEPLTPSLSLEPVNGRRQIPGSVSFVPSVAGLIIAGEVIKDICIVESRA